jgi:hypothetical protein
MHKQKEVRVEKDNKARKHENVLAAIIKEALDAEQVAEIPFNKQYITDEQMKLIMLKAATSSDQRELFGVLLDEVTEEILYEDLPACKRKVEDEIVSRENDVLLDMDVLLCTFTLRQLRDELKRYGKEESEFRAELSKVSARASERSEREECAVASTTWGRFYGIAQRRRSERSERKGTCSCLFPPFDICGIAQSKKSCCSPSPAPLRPAPPRSSPLAASSCLLLRVARSSPTWTALPSGACCASSAW